MEAARKATRLRAVAALLAAILTEESIVGGQLLGKGNELGIFEVGKRLRRKTPRFNSSGEYNDGDRCSGHEVEWEAGGKKRSSDLFARKHVFTTRACPSDRFRPGSCHSCIVPWGFPWVPGNGVDPPGWQVPHGVTCACRQLWNVEISFPQALRGVFLVWTAE